MVCARMQMAGHVLLEAEFAFYAQIMTSRIASNDLFPLLELPDVVLANVLQRCPPGSIAGFPLPLALAQVRVKGSVDPYWLRPLVHAASKCPAVLNRVSPHLRSVELLETQSTSSLITIAPFLTRLERLSIGQQVSTVTLATLPTGLTKLSVWGVDLEGTSLEDLSASLLRLTALEDLDLGFLSRNDRWTVGGSLPLLWRLKHSWPWGMLPRDLGTFAPNLKALEGNLACMELEQLPITLTRLRFVGRWTPEGSLLPLTRLTGLKDLGLGPYMGIPKELPKLLEDLAALTNLKAWSQVTYTYHNLPQLVEALERGPEGLGLCLDEIYLNASSCAVERLFRHLVEVKFLVTDNPASLPWAALTRLTRLVLVVDSSKDASWVQPLSQLPSLKDLEVMLRGQVPAGFGALTQCTKLKLTYIESNANLSCLLQLTRLRECQLEKSPIECLAALPDCLTKLSACDINKSPDLPLGQTLQHLTALKHLEIWCPEGEDQAYDLSPLRLNSLLLLRAPRPLLRLGPLPCLRSLHLSQCEDTDKPFLQQLGQNAPSLRVLTVESFFRVTDADLNALTCLSLLDVLKIPREVGRIHPEGLRRLLDHLPLLDWLIVQGVDLDEGLAWAELKRLVGDRLRLLTSSGTDVMVS